MPYINARVSKRIEKEQEEKVKTELGKLIEIFPGKTESWLMVDIEDDCHLYLAGNQNRDTAYLKIEVFGKLNPSCCEKMTAAVCELFERELQIPADRVYVVYEGVENWGFNGSNF